MAKAVAGTKATKQHLICRMHWEVQFWFSDQDCGNLLFLDEFKSC